MFLEVDMIAARLELSGFVFCRDISVDIALTTSYLILLSNIKKLGIGGKIKNLDNRDHF